MEQTLRQSILQTLAWFDVFDMPLTKEEVFRWIIDYTERLDYTELFDALGTLVKDGSIGYTYGFYFLHGREELVMVRQRGVIVVEKKMKIAVRACKIMRWVPFCRAVFVCNTVASSSADDCSDIDVFVVTKDGHLWMSRFLLTGLLSLFGLRRHGKRVKNKICLSFYVTDVHLDLADIRIDSPDIYLAYWIDQLIPVYDPENVHADILNANQWVKNLLPHALLSYETLHRWRVDDWKPQQFLKQFFERVWKGGYGDLLERQAKEIQKKKMDRNFGSKSIEDNTHVVIDDTMLKFHENDRRAFYREEWKNRCSSRHLDCNFGEAQNEVERSHD